MASVDAIDSGAPYFVRRQISPRVHASLAWNRGRFAPREFSLLMLSLKAPAAPCFARSQISILDREPPERGPLKT